MIAWICKHCKKEFKFGVGTPYEVASRKANHSRWCEHNPKRNSYVDALLKRDNVGLMLESKRKSGIYNHFIKKQKESTDGI